MKLLSTFSQEDEARLFGDHLISLSIDNQVDQADGSWEIWVHDEDLLAQAQGELIHFQTNPADDRFVKAREIAQKIRKQQQKDNEKSRGLYQDARHINMNAHQPKATRVLIGICVVLYVISHFSEVPLYFHPILRYFFINDVFIHSPFFGNVMSGEIWRLFTPMLLHGSIMHILFNMMWLHSLGTIIEGRKGMTFFLILVLFSSGLSNCAQYLMTGPNFLGMSGVVYGLLGYLWMKMKYQPHERLGIDPGTVTFMLIWLVVCMLGIIPDLDVANWAHGIGLLSGMAYAYVPYALKKTKK
ncbi:MAG: rhomboid family intramembrane serine protease [Planctomycetes bacterium]|nr:rhomboid family intramembrane serine protease [Planctomycetota bacterium]